jgi:hypothetical protein
MIRCPEVWTLWSAQEIQIIWRCSPGKKTETLQKWTSSQESNTAGYIAYQKCHEGFLHLYKLLSFLQYSINCNMWLCAISYHCYNMDSSHLEKKRTKEETFDSPPLFLQKKNKGRNFWFDSSFPPKKNKGRNFWFDSSSSRLMRRTHESYSAREKKGSHLPG